MTATTETKKISNQRITNTWQGTAWNAFLSRSFSGTVPANLDNANNNDTLTGTWRSSDVHGTALNSEPRLDLETKGLYQLTSFS